MFGDFWMDGKPSDQPLPPCTCGKDSCNMCSKKLSKSASFRAPNFEERLRNTHPEYRDRLIGRLHSFSVLFFKI